MQKDFGRLTKADSSPVTIADLAAQMAIAQGIRKSFPHDLIIAEEDSCSLEYEEIRSNIKAVIDLFEIPVFIHQTTCI